LIGKVDQVMKVVTVAGVQGSGKTTLIREMVERLVRQGKRCAVIENEQGEAGYDEGFIKTHHLGIERLRGG
jgi:G3E family GTPase